ncbi:hypothetical protein P7C70_g9661, partial [Phenoliferia sp. Uapishka_3]
MVQTFTGRKLKQFGADGGGEFVNKACDKLFSDNGTERFITPAYTSQRNGRSERPNRTIPDAIRTVRIESGLGAEWWAEISEAFAVAKNLSPHEAIGGAVPDALWYPNKPDVSFLRPIGCKGTRTILTKQEHQNKTEPRGQTVVLLNYQRNSKAYRVLDPETGLVHVSRDVKFEEDVFPLKLDTIGGVHLNSAPPSVRPGGVSSVPDLPLTVFDEFGTPLDDDLGEDPIPIPPVAPPIVPALPEPRIHPDISSPNRYDSLELEQSSDLEEDSPTPDSPPALPRIQPPGAPRAQRVASVRQVSPPAAPNFGVAPTSGPPPIDPDESLDPLDILPR